MDEFKEKLTALVDDLGHWGYAWGGWEHEPQKEQVEELLAMFAAERALLKKYAQHVNQVEGTHFLGESRIIGLMPWDIEFTESEREILRKIREELDG